MNLHKWLAFPAAALAIASCDTVRVTDLESGMAFYDGSFQYATRSGAIKTFVIGSPFSGGAADGFAANVRNAMGNAPFGHDVAFVPATRDKSKNAFHVVALFNGVNPLNEREICERDVEIATQPNTSTTSMVAIFCQGKHPISYASGFVDSLSGPNDPRFHKLVVQVARAMIPGYDADWNSSGFTPF